MLQAQFPATKESALREGYNITLSKRVLVSTEELFGVKKRPLDMHDLVKAQAGKVGSSEAQRIVRALLQTQETLNQNVNDRIALEVLMLDMPTLKNRSRFFTSPLCSSLLKSYLDHHLPVIIAPAVASDIP